MKVNKGMVLTVAFLIIAIISAGSVFAEEKKEAPKKEYFEFSSGGAYHFEGQGEWTVRIDSEGEMSIKHNVQGKIKDYGKFKLTDKEKDKFERLFEKANLGMMKVDDRPGVPDEVQYFFSWFDGKKFHSFKIWINDARNKRHLWKLTQYLGTLIEKYAKTKPVIN